jgi:hypothetical protein
MEFVADLLNAVIAGVRDAAAAWWPSVVVAAIVLALTRAGVGSRWRLRAPRSPVTAYVVIAVVALLAAAARTIIVGEPRPPWFLDDYGYLLISDTFLHGRITNPPHPMRAYFISPYILQTPHYTAMYAPLEPLLLAFGRLIAGAPVVGLWIASAAAACGIAWAAAAIVTLDVAFAAGLLCAIHPIVLYWADSMHGGALAAAGGALAIGGALRMPARRAVVAMAVGFVILANTRPYEGFVVACIAVALAIREWRAVAVAAGIACVLLSGTAVYDAAVTGNPFLMPYNAYNAQWLSAPNFIWQKPLPQHAYPNYEMAHTYDVFRRYYERSRHWRDFSVSVPERIADMAWAIPTCEIWWLNGLRAFAALPLLFAFRRRWKLWVALAVFVAAILQITWWPQMQYLAPAAALFAVLYAAGVARMLETGRALAAVTCAGVLFVIAGVAYAGSLDDQRPPSPRNAVVEALHARAGKQLVIADDRCLNVVFNGAAIDQEKIVFAHHVATGATGDAPLLAYYADREVWRLSCTPFALVLVRPALIPFHGTAERDLFYPWHFPGGLRQSSR